MADKRPRILTTRAQILCPHAGQVIPTTTNTQLKVDGAFALLESDIHTVVGCPFCAVPPYPSPCISVRWVAGDVQTKVNGVKVLVETSQGFTIGGPGGLPVIIVDPGSNVGGT